MDCFSKDKCRIAALSGVEEAYWDEQSVVLGAWVHKEATAHHTFAVAVSLAEWAEQVEYAGLLRTADGTRDAANAAHVAALEIAQATSAKTHAMDVASAEKDFQVAKVQGTESATTHKTDIADALLAHTTGLDDAKLAYQTSESTVRQTYLQNTSPAEKNRAIDLTGIDKKSAPRRLTNPILQFVSIRRTASCEGW